MKEEPTLYSHSFMRGVVHAIEGIDTGTSMLTVFEKNKKLDYNRILNTINADNFSGFPAETDATVFFLATGIFT